MIVLDSSLPIFRPEDISIDFIERCIITNSFVMDGESPSLAFVINDEGYIDIIPSDQKPSHCGYYFENPFGKHGLPRGLRNMLIETEEDLSDYKKLIFEEFQELECEIEEAYGDLSDFTEPIGFLHDFDLEYDDLDPDY